MDQRWKTVLQLLITTINIVTDNMVALCSMHYSNTVRKLADIAAPVASNGIAEWVARVGSLLLASSF